MPSEFSYVINMVIKCFSSQLKLFITHEEIELEMNWLFLGNQHKS